jgi:hypothetical protein
MCLELPPTTGYHAETICEYLLPRTNYVSCHSIAVKMKSTERTVDADGSRNDRCCMTKYFIDSLDLLRGSSFIDKKSCSTFVIEREEGIKFKQKKSLSFLLLLLLSPSFPQ